MERGIARGSARLKARKQILIREVSKKEIVGGVSGGVQNEGGGCRGKPVNTQTKNNYFQIKQKFYECPPIVTRVKVCE